MKTRHEVKQPDTSYLKLQGQLLGLLERNEPGQTALRAEMAEKFAESFELKPLSCRRAARLAIGLDKLVPGLLDHDSAYQAWLAPVLTVQPYGASERANHDPDIILLESLGCAVWDLTAWSFHYPGKTAMFGIVIGKVAAKALRLVSTALEPGQHARELSESLVGFGPFERSLAVADYINIPALDVPLAQGA